MTVTYIKMLYALAQHHIQPFAHPWYASIPILFCVIVVLASPSITTLFIRRRCGRPTSFLMTGFHCAHAFPKLTSTYYTPYPPAGRHCLAPRHCLTHSPGGAPDHLVPCLLLALVVLLVTSVYMCSRSLSLQWAGL